MTGRYPPNPGGKLWFECRPGSGPATSPSFWTISHAFPGAMPPCTRRVVCSTWCPGLPDADWGGGAIRWCDQFGAPGPCDPRPKWPVTYLMNESVALMAFTTGLAANGKPASYPDNYPAVTGTTVPASYPANRWAIFDIDCAATSTSFRTFFRAFFCSPPHMRCVPCSTWWPC